MHKNNFDFLRLIFALCVIITHSYTLTGDAETDWLYTITKGQVFFSYIGVRGFFVISGFLIFQSIMRTESIIDYFRNRCLRIFPGLAVVLALTVIFSFFFYSGDFHSYITNKSVWTYFPNNIKLFRLQGTIQGVFENNPYRDDVNGSIWTIQYEFICYILVASLFFIKKKSSLIVSLFALFFLICNIFFINSFKKINFIVFGYDVIDFSTFFFAGAVLANLKIEKLPYRKIIIAASLLSMVVSVPLGIFRYTHLLAFPVIVILAGVSSTKLLTNFTTKAGDLSYGIYIYAFIIQQALFHFFKIGKWEMTLWASAISMIFGYLSWHFIEKPSLRFKRHSQK
ncbi:MAG: acyltransferase [Bacteroidetes bacterium]|nr:acyltransferase [Bacteroidota bacterium]